VIDRDSLIEFIEEKRSVIIIVTAAILAFLLVVLVLMFVSLESAKKKAAAIASAQKANSLSAAELWLPSEPLDIPGIQNFRAPRQRWSPEEVKQWYTEGDAASLGELRGVGRKQIDALLESVP
jgi:hypothetical protein